MFSLDLLKQLVFSQRSFFQINDLLNRLKNFFLFYIIIHPILYCKEEQNFYIYRYKIEKEQLYLSVCLWDQLTGCPNIHLFMQHQPINRKM